MISIIILVLSLIASLVSIIMFKNLEGKTAYDLRTFKFGLFLYFVVILFDLVNALADNFLGIKAFLDSIQLPASYLILASKFVLIPLVAIVFLVGIFRIYQEISADSFKAQMEKL
jgi:hypothetical protein